MVRHAAYTPDFRSALRCEVENEHVEFAFVLFIDYTLTAPRGEYDMICQSAMTHIAKLTKSYRFPTFSAAFGRLFCVCAISPGRLRRAPAAGATIIPHPGRVRHGGGYHSNVKPMRSISQGMGGLSL